MNENYYLVETMCGHVGKRSYIPIKFAIKAESAKDAAKIARDIPRVKHENKYAILGVEKVSYEEFQKQEEINKNDQYLNWRECRFDNDFDQDGIVKRVVSYDSVIEYKERKEKEHHKRKRPRREAMNSRRIIIEGMLSLEA